MIHTRFRMTAAAFLVPWSLTAAVIAEDPVSDPKEVLRRAKDVVRQGKVVSYDVTIEATEWLKARVPATQGKAIVGPLAEYDVPRFYCEVELRKADSEERLVYKAGCDGKNYYLIDDKAKKAYSDIDPLVLGSNARDIQRACLRELTDKEPFKGELESESPELRGTVEVGGAKCYEVFVPVKTGPYKAALWAFSTKDFLPRRVMRYYAAQKPGDPDAMTTFTLTNLVVGPKSDKDPFAPVVPAGFTKTDDFAP